MIRVCKQCCVVPSGGCSPRKPPQGLAIVALVRVSKLPALPCSCLLSSVRVPSILQEPSGLTPGLERRPPTWNPLCLGRCHLQGQPDRLHACLRVAWRLRVPADMTLHAGIHDQGHERAAVGREGFLARAGDGLDSVSWARLFSGTNFFTSKRRQGGGT